MKNGKIEEIKSIVDLQRLLDEATPESARDRLRRRSAHQQRSVRSHQDEKGHSDLHLPVFADRTQPKRERSDNTQMQHRGKLGHRHSARAQRGAPKHFSEAIEFINAYIGQPVDMKLLSEIEDKRALHLLATRLMARPGVNRDWLHGLCDLLGSKNG